MNQKYGFDDARLVESIFMLVQYISVVLFAIVFLLVIVVMWLSTPPFPDMHVHPFVIAVKMWLGDIKTFFECETDASLTPLKDINRRIRTLATVIKAPERLLPKHQEADFDNTMIEYDGRYRYLFGKRGERFDERLSNDIDEILYWTFDKITSAMADEHLLAREHPQADDFRQVSFEHQLELMHKLRPAWAQRRRAELDDILGRNRYTDCN